jgi:hypothetical protein
MPRDPVTLVLEGDIPLDEFANAQDGLRDLIEALTEEVAKGIKIDWTVDALEARGALITVRGQSEVPQAVENVIDAYLAVGRAEARHDAIPFKPAVHRAIQAITSVLNGRIKAIRFETAEGEATIQRTEADTRTAPPLSSTYGAIQGRVQTLPSRGSLRFTLYDLLNNRAVSCYLETGFQAKMRDCWGKLATVEGWVTRDGLTGRPLSVRRIASVQPRLEVEPGSFRQSKGAVRAPANPASPEGVIRRMRDGWHALEEPA